MESLTGGGERATDLVVAVVGPVGVPHQDHHAGRHHGQGQGHHGGPPEQARPPGGAGPAHPTNLAVEPAPPNRRMESRKLRTTTVMIETRMARPAATPTPAGPPPAR